MRPLPSLYPITDASSPESLTVQVARLGNVGFPLVQFRAKPLDPKRQWDHLRSILTSAQENGGWPQVSINDRVDLAVLAASENLAPWGLHLGQGDLSPKDALRLPGLERLRMGGSTHSLLEWTSITTPVDHAGIGPVRATGSKSDHAAPIGFEGLAKGCRILRAKDIAPIAIGGLTMEDAEACFRAGAESIAMISGLSRSLDPTEVGWGVQRARFRGRPFDLRRGVVLVGSSGAGKSALGEQVASRLHLPFLDLDVVVARGQGRSIAEIFVRDGEQAFRAMEVGYLRPALERPAVIALGGGAWESEAIRDAVAASGAQVLWLAESPAICWSRVASDPARPLAKDRAGFMDRHRTRLKRWSELPSLSAFGHAPQDLALALTPEP